MSLTYAARMTANAGTDAAVAVAAAQAGAAVVRAMFGSALARFDKSGGDFATAADLAAEKAPDRQRALGGRHCPLPGGRMRRDRH